MPITLFHRISAAFTAAVFILTGLVQPNTLLAAEVPALLKNFPAELSNVRIPANIGKMEEAFEGGDDLVILVQDAHAIPEAQRSIRNLIDFFQQTYGLGTIALEGAASKLNPQIFRSFPDQESLKRVFDEYLRAGELAGPVFASIANQEDALYKGVEDWRLYESGYAYYLEALAAAPAISQKLEALEGGLQNEKERIYSPGLLKIDGALRQFRENKADLLAVLKMLAEVSPPPADSELALMLAEGSREEESAASLEMEVRKFAEAVKKSLGQEMRASAKSSGVHAEFNEKFQQFRTSQISYQEFALYLKDFISRLQLRMELPGRLLEAAGTQKRMKDIEGSRFFEAFQEYAASVKEKLFKSEEERALDRKAETLYLFEKLSALELTRAEWERFRPVLEGEKGTDAAPVDGGLKKQFAPHAAFYKNSEDRDAAFFRNLQGLLRDQAGNNTRIPLIGNASSGKDQRRAVLFVAGGFHTETLTRHFREAGLSYLLVMPKISRMPEEIHYKEHMRGQVSWKDYFEVENGRLNVYKAFVRATRDKLLQAWTEASGPAQAETRGKLLKMWRDQILRDLAEEGRLLETPHYTGFIDELAEEGKRLEKDMNLAGKVERFIEGMRELKSSGKLNEENLMRLLRPSAMLSALVVPAEGQTLGGPAANVIIAGLGLEGAGIQDVSGAQTDAMLISKIPGEEPGSGEPPPETPIFTEEVMTSGIRSELRMNEEQRQYTDQAYEWLKDQVPEISSVDFDRSAILMAAWHLSQAGLGNDGIFNEIRNILTGYFSAETRGPVLAERAEDELIWRAIAMKAETQPDYYEVLELSRDASADQVKDAYRTLSKKHHPDTNPGDKEAEKRFREINAAYEALFDEEKREKYNAPYFIREIYSLVPASGENLAALRNKFERLSAALEEYGMIPFELIQIANRLEDVLRNAASPWAKQLEKDLTAAAKRGSKADRLKVEEIWSEAKEAETLFEWSEYQGIETTYQQALARFAKRDQWAGIIKTSLEGISFAGARVASRDRSMAAIDQAERAFREWGLSDAGTENASGTQIGDERFAELTALYEKKDAAIQLITRGFIDLRNHEKGVGNIGDFIDLLFERKIIPPEVGVIFPGSPRAVYDAFVYKHLKQIQHIEVMVRLERAPGSFTGPIGEIVRSLPSVRSELRAPVVEQREIASRGGTKYRSTTYLFGEREITRFDMPAAAGGIFTVYLEGRNSHNTIGVSLGIVVDGRDTGEYRITLTTQRASARGEDFTGSISVEIDSQGRYLRTSGLPSEGVVPAEEIQALEAEEQARTAEASQSQTAADPNETFREQVVAWLTPELPGLAGYRLPAADLAEAYRNLTGRSLDHNQAMQEIRRILTEFFNSGGTITVGPGEYLKRQSAKVPKAEAAASDTRPQASEADVTAWLSKEVPQLTGRRFDSKVFFAAYAAYLESGLGHEEALGQMKADLGEFFAGQSGVNIITGGPDAYVMRLALKRRLSALESNLMPAADLQARLIRESGLKTNLSIDAVSAARKALEAKGYSPDDIYQYLLSILRRTLGNIHAGGAAADAVMRQSADSAPSRSELRTAQPYNFTGLFGGDLAMFETEEDEAAGDALARRIGKGVLEDIGYKKGDEINAEGRTFVVEEIHTQIGPVEETEEYIARLGRAVLTQDKYQLWLMGRDKASGQKVFMKTLSNEDAAETVSKMRALVLESFAGIEAFAPLPSAGSSIPEYLLVTEVVPESFEDMMRGAGFLLPMHKLFYFAENILRLAKDVQKMHEAGIEHGDIQYFNVRGENGKWKLIDPADPHGVDDLEGLAALLYTALTGRKLQFGIWEAGLDASFGYMDGDGKLRFPSEQNLQEALDAGYPELSGTPLSSALTELIYETGMSGKGDLDSFISGLERIQEALGLEDFRSGTSLDGDDLRSELRSDDQEGTLSAGAIGPETEFYIKEAQTERDKFLESEFARLVVLISEIKEKLLDNPAFLDYVNRTRLELAKERSARVNAFTQTELNDLIERLPVHVLAQASYAAFAGWEGEDPYLGIFADYSALLTREEFIFLFGHELGHILFGAAREISDEEQAIMTELNAAFASGRTPNLNEDQKQLFSKYSKDEEKAADQMGGEVTRYVTGSKAGANALAAGVLRKADEAAKGLYYRRPAWNMNDFGIATHPDSFVRSLTVLSPSEIAGSVSEGFFQQVLLEILSSGGIEAAIRVPEIPIVDFATLFAGFKTNEDTRSELRMIDRGGKLQTARSGKDADIIGGLTLPAFEEEVYRQAPFFQMTGQMGGDLENYLSSQGVLRPAEREEDGKWDPQSLAHAKALVWSAYEIIAARRDEEAALAQPALPGTGPKGEAAEPGDIRDERIIRRLTRPGGSLAEEVLDQTPRLEIFGIQGALRRFFTESGFYADNPQSVNHAKRLVRRAYGILKARVDLGRLSPDTAVRLASDPSMARAIRASVNPRNGNVILVNAIERALAESGVIRAKPGGRWDDWDPSTVEAAKAAVARAYQILIQAQEDAQESGEAASVSLIGDEASGYSFVIEALNLASGERERMITEPFRISFGQAETILSFAEGRLSPLEFYELRDSLITEIGNYADAVREDAKQRLKALKPDVESALDALAENPFADRKSHIRKLTNWIGRELGSLNGASAETGLPVFYIEHLQAAFKYLLARIGHPEAAVPEISVIKEPGLEDFGTITGYDGLEVLQLAEWSGTVTQRGLTDVRLGGYTSGLEQLVKAVIDQALDSRAGSARDRNDPRSELRSDVPRTLLSQTWAAYPGHAITVTAGREILRIQIEAPGYSKIFLVRTRTEAAAAEVLDFLRRAVVSLNGNAALSRLGPAGRFARWAARMPGFEEKFVEFYRAFEALYQQRSNELKFAAMVRGSGSKENVSAAAQAIIAAEESTNRVFADGVYGESIDENRLDKAMADLRERLGAEGFRDAFTFLAEMNYQDETDHVTLDNLIENYLAPLLGSRPNLADERLLDALMRRWIQNDLLTPGWKNVNDLETDLVETSPHLQARGLGVRAGAIARAWGEFRSSEAPLPASSVPSGAPGSFYYTADQLRKFSEKLAGEFPGLREDTSAFPLETASEAETPADRAAGEPSPPADGAEAAAPRTLVRGSSVTDAEMTRARKENISLLRSSFDEANISRLAEVPNDIFGAAAAAAILVYPQMAAKAEADLKALIANNPKAMSRLLTHIPVLISALPLEIRSELQKDGGTSQKALEAFIGSLFVGKNVRGETYYAGPRNPGEGGRGIDLYADYFHSVLDPAAFARRQILSPRILYSLSVLIRNLNRAALQDRDFFAAVIGNINQRLTSTASAIYAESFLEEHLKLLHGVFHGTLEDSSAASVPEISFERDFLGMNGYEEIYRVSVITARGKTPLYEIARYRTVGEYNSADTRESIRRSFLNEDGVIDVFYGLVTGTETAAEGPAAPPSFVQEESVPGPSEERLADTGGVSEAPADLGSVSTGPAALQPRELSPEAAEAAAAILQILEEPGDFHFRDEVLKEKRERISRIGSRIGDEALRDIFIGILAGWNNHRIKDISRDIFVDAYLAPLLERRPDLQNGSTRQAMEELGFRTAKETAAGAGAAAEAETAGRRPEEAAKEEAAPKVPVYPPAVSGRLLAFAERAAAMGNEEQRSVWERFRDEVRGEGLRLGTVESASHILGLNRTSSFDYADLADEWTDLFQNTPELADFRDYSVPAAPGEFDTFSLGDDEFDAETRSELRAVLDPAFQRNVLAGFEIAPRIPAGSSDTDILWFFLRNYTFQARELTEIMQGIIPESRATDEQRARQMTVPLYQRIGNSLSKALFPEAPETAHREGVTWTLRERQKAGYFSIIFFYNFEYEGEKKSLAINVPTGVGHASEVVKRDVETQNYYHQLGRTQHHPGLLSPVPSSFKHEGFTAVSPLLMGRFVSQLDRAAYQRLHATLSEVQRQGQIAPIEGTMNVGLFEAVPNSTEIHFTAPANGTLPVLWEVNPDGSKRFVRFENPHGIAARIIGTIVYFTEEAEDSLWTVGDIFPNAGDFVYQKDPATGEDDILMITMRGRRQVSVPGFIDSLIHFYAMDEQRPADQMVMTERARVITAYPIPISNPAIAFHGLQRGLTELYGETEGRARLEEWLGLYSASPLSEPYRAYIERFLRGELPLTEDFSALGFRPEAPPVNRSEMRMREAAEDFLARLRAAPDGSARGIIETEMRLFLQDKTGAAPFLEVFLDHLRESGSAAEQNIPDILFALGALHAVMRSLSPYQLGSGRYEEIPVIRETARTVLAMFDSPLAEDSGFLHGLELVLRRLGWNFPVLLPEIFQKMESLKRKAREAESENPSAVYRLSMAVNYMDNGLRAGLGSLPFRDEIFNDMMGMATPFTMALAGIDPNDPGSPESGRENFPFRQWTEAYPFAAIGMEDMENLGISALYYIGLTASSETSGYARSNPETVSGRRAAVLRWVWEEFRREVKETQEGWLAQPEDIRNQMLPHGYVSDAQKLLAEYIRIVRALLEGADPADVNQLKTLFFSDDAQLSGFVGRSMEPGVFRLKIGRQLFWLSVFGNEEAGRILRSDQNLYQSIEAEWNALPMRSGAPGTTGRSELRIDSPEFREFLDSVIGRNAAAQLERNWEVLNTLTDPEVLRLRYEEDPAAAGVLGILGIQLETWDAVKAAEAIGEALNDRRRAMGNILDFLLDNIFELNEEQQIRLFRTQLLDYALTQISAETDPRDFPEEAPGLDTKTPQLSGHPSAGLGNKFLARANRAALEGRFEEARGLYADALSLRGYGAFAKALGEEFLDSVRARFEELDALFPSFNAETFGTTWAGRLAPLHRHMIGALIEERRKAGIGLDQPIVVVDVGIGKAGAPTTFGLLDLLKEAGFKNIKIIGADKNASYVESARRSAAQQDLSSVFQFEVVSDFDLAQIESGLFDGEGRGTAELIFISNVLLYYRGKEDAIIQRLLKGLAPSGLLAASEGPAEQAPGIIYSVYRADGTPAARNAFIEAPDRNGRTTKDIGGVRLANASAKQRDRDAGSRSELRFDFKASLQAGTPIEVLKADVFEDLFPGLSADIVGHLVKERVLAPHPEGGVLETGFSKPNFNNPFTPVSILKLDGAVLGAGAAARTFTAGDEKRVFDRLAEIQTVNDTLRTGEFYRVDVTSLDALISALSPDVTQGSNIQIVRALVRWGEEAVPALAGLLENPEDERVYYVVEVMKGLAKRGVDLKSQHGAFAAFVKAVDEFNDALPEDLDNRENLAFSKMERALALLALSGTEPGDLNLLISVSQKYLRSREQVYQLIEQMGPELGEADADRAVQAIEEGVRETERRLVMSLRGKHSGDSALRALRAVRPGYTEDDLFGPKDPNALKSGAQIFTEALEALFSEDGLGEEYGRRLLDDLDALRSRRPDYAFAAETILPVIAETIQKVDGLLKLDETGAVEKAYADPRELKYSIVRAALGFHDPNTLWGIAQGGIALQLIPREELLPLDPFRALQKVIRILMRGDHPTVKLLTLWSEPENIASILTGGVYFTLKEELELRREVDSEVNAGLFSGGAAPLDILAKIRVHDSEENLADLARRLSSQGVSRGDVNSLLAAFTWMNGAAEYDSFYSKRIDQWFGRYKERTLSGLPEETAADLLAALVTVYYAPSYNMRPFTLARSISETLEAALSPGRSELRSGEEEVRRPLLFTQAWLDRRMMLAASSYDRIPVRRGVISSRVLAEVRRILTMNQIPGAGSPELSILDFSSRGYRLTNDQLSSMIEAALPQSDKKLEPFRRAYLGRIGSLKSAADLSPPLFPSSLEDMSRNRRRQYLNDELGDLTVRGQKPELEEIRAYAEYLRDLLVERPDGPDDELEKDAAFERKAEGWKKLDFSVPQDLEKFLIGTSVYFLLDTSSIPLLEAYLEYADRETDDRVIRWLRFALGSRKKEFGADSIQMELISPSREQETDEEGVRRITADLFSSPLHSGPWNLLTNIIAKKYSPERMELLESLRDDSLLDVYDRSREYPTILWDGMLKRLLEQSFSEIIDRRGSSAPEESRSELRTSSPEGSLSDGDTGARPELRRQAAPSVFAAAVLAADMAGYPVPESLLQETLRIAANGNDEEVQAQLRRIAANLEFSGLLAQATQTVLTEWLESFFSNMAAILKEYGVSYDEAISFGLILEDNESADTTEALAAGLSAFNIERMIVAGKENTAPFKDAERFGIFTPVKEDYFRNKKTAHDRRISVANLRGGVLVQQFLEFFSTVGADGMEEISDPLIRKEIKTMIVPGAAAMLGKILFANPSLPRDAQEAALIRALGIVSTEKIVAGAGNHFSYNLRAINLDLQRRILETVAASA